MKRSLLLSTLLASALLAQPVAAASLRASVTVSSDIVRLGDLVEGALPAKADLPLFRAPDLGHTGDVSAAAVLAAARARGITDIDTHGLQQVAVTHEGRVIAAADMLPPLREALATVGHIEDPEAVQIALDDASRQVVFPTNATGAFSIEDASWNSASGSFAAVISITCENGTSRTAQITGTAVETVPVLVASHDMARGDVLTAADLTLRTMPRAEIPANSFSDNSHALGMEVRRGLREGQAIRATDIDEPLLVKRSSAVSLVFTSGALTLTARGQALRDGSRGEVVTVMNQQSKRVLEGTVTGPGEVTITPARVLANAS